MDFNFDVNAPTITGGGGGGSVTQVGTGTGLTGGPITTIGTILFASIPDMNLLANISGGTAPPIPNTLTAILDYVLDNTQGDLIYRNGTVWTFLAPGVSGQVLSSGGPAANPAWTDVGEGTVLSVDTGTGLTGGPITSTGTISLADITSSQLLANLTLGSAAPLPHTLTAILDYVLDNTQGDLIYRNGTVWTTLLPGTVGQVLTSGGGGANPSWETTGSGSVTSIDTGTGLTGGPITDTGTIEFDNVPAGYTLANLTDIVAPPLPHTVSDVLDFDFTDIQGSILYRANAEWSYLIPSTSGYVLTSNGPNQNPAWLPGGGGGGGFNPVNTIYFAVGGNDSAAGTINAPLATLGQAVTNANALSIGGAAFISIIGLGVGVDVSNVSITHNGIDIYAPGYQLNPVSGDALTVTLTGVSGGSYINVVLGPVTVTSGAKCLNLISTSAGNNNVTQFIFGGELTGDVYLNALAKVVCTIISGVCTVNVVGTVIETLYGIGSLNQASRLNLAGISIGANGTIIQGHGEFTNTFRYPMRDLVQLVSDYTLVTTDSGKVFVNATTSNFTVTLPQVSNQGTPPFLVGYETEFLNLSTGSIAFAVQGSDVLVGTTVINISGQRVKALEEAAGIWTVDAQGGGSGGGFSYINAFWVAQNGNDSNSGLSIDSPKLTIQGAIDAITATTSPNTIIIEDSGAYFDDFTITLPGLSIFAPSATVSTATITMSANSGVGPTLYGNQLVFRSWDGVTYNDTSITRLAAYDEVILNISNMTNSTNLSMGARNTNIVANLFDVNTCAISVSNTATLISLNISETASNSISVFYNPLTNLDFASWVNVTGNIGKIDLATGAAIGTISLAQNIDPTWFNSIVLFTPSGDINLSFPDSVDATIPIGWETDILRNGGSGNVNFVAPGAVTLLSPYNNPETAGNASVVSIRKVASQLYILSGDLQNNSGGEVSQIFVSQETGSDVTGNGSYTKPYASIGAGVTAAGTPTTPTSIFIIDGATYIEAVTVSHPNIYIIGPEALLLNNIGGNALTFTTNATQHFVNLGGLAASGGGSALVNSGTSSIVSTGEVIDGPIQTVNGQIFIRSVQLTGSFASIGSGFIRYTTVLRNGGTDGTNVVGSNSAGTLGNWAVDGNLSASGLNYPSVDGTAGQVITTDGAGNLSLQYPASVIWSGISGTTQAATVNSGYVIENAAQTTVTLPATAVKGNTVIVKGLGAAGWILAANIGQTIVSPALSTSSGGTLTSANQYDSISVTCIEDNTVWSLDWTTSTGLTPT